MLTLIMYPWIFVCFLLVIHQLSAQDCVDSIPYEPCSPMFNRCELLSTIKSYKDSTHLDVGKLFFIEHCALKHKDKLSINQTAPTILTNLTHLTSFSTPIFSPIPKNINALIHLKTLRQYPYHSSFFFNLLYQLPPSIPNSLWDLKQLEHLSIYTIDVPSAITKLNKLKTLEIHLEGTQTASFLSPKEWESFSQLESLVLIANCFSNNTIRTLANINTLQSFALITNIPNNGVTESLKAMQASKTSLKKIHISTRLDRYHSLYFKEKTSPLNTACSTAQSEQVKLSGNFQNLEQLILKDCALKSIALEQVSLPKLTHLDLSHNQLQKIIVQERQLEHLKIKTLNLAHNYLSNLPPQFTQLKLLESINLQGNAITHLPINLEHLPKLKEIILSPSFLHPSTLTQLKKRFGNKLILKEEEDWFINPKPLNLTSNYSMAFDKEALVYEYDSNNWSKLPIIKKKKSVKSLSLTKNIFAQIPSKVFCLRQLESLSLKYNLLVGLSTKIQQLKALKKLDLSYNSIQMLPKELANLSKLEYLDLSHNALTTLPKEIATLKQLQFLSLSHNPINELPDQLKELQQLKSIYISNDLPKTIQQQLMNWFGQDRVIIVTKHPLTLKAPLPFQ